MKYQPKVNSTQKHSDSQGEHIVCEGKLVLLEDKMGYKPIIISETEEIEVGDYHINMHTSPKERSIQQYTHPRHLKNAKKDWRFEYECKILALPEHFSDKHLQAIVDGKMKDGDKVLLKCTEKNGFSLNTSLHNNNFIWLTKEGHITLFPAEQSLEEVVNRVRDKYDHEKYYDKNYNHIPSEQFKEGVEWAVKNNYKGE